jgi:hypothetical protein
MLTRRNKSGIIILYDYEKKSHKKGVTMYCLTNNQNQEEKNVTREEWLNSAKEELRPLFLIAGYDLPEKIRLSVGFSGKNVRGSRNGSRVLGVAYNHIISADDHTEIFITPELGKESAVDILAILVHELIHAIHPSQGHNAIFGRTARSLGLVGALRSTIAGEGLRLKLEAIARYLSRYVFPRRV